MTTEQTFNQHTLVNYDKLLSDDSNEIYRLENEFKSNGWCFIELPNDNGRLGKTLREIQTTLMNFFSQTEEQKTTSESSNAFGYSRVGHKEGIKVLTDQYGLRNDHRPLTEDVEHTLQYLAVLFRNFTDVLKTIIFKMPTFAQAPTQEVAQLSPLTMLDIVHYFNKRAGPTIQPKIGLNTAVVNCVPHFDPGLFSLSILSTCEGLQLNDLLQDKWIDGVINSESDQHHIGVIWLGEAASILTQNRFKSGIHRVVYPHTPHKPRLTIWQEVCTVSQIEPLLRPDNDDIFVTNGTAVQLTNQLNSAPFPVQSGGENRKKFMKRVEHDRGISISKSAPHHVKMAQYKNKHNNEMQEQQQQQSHPRVLPEGASVTMKNQPNSVPLNVAKGGETVIKFMKRIEIDRGLSMSKIDFHHLLVEASPPMPTTADDSQKKSSVFSKRFKRKDK